MSLKWPTLTKVLSLQGSHAKSHGAWMPRLVSSVTPELGTGSPRKAGRTPQLSWSTLTARSGLGERTVGENDGGVRLLGLGVHRVDVESDGAPALSYLGSGALYTLESNSHAQRRDSAEAAPTLGVNPPSLPHFITAGVMG